jgi:hypothetical protein
MAARSQRTTLKLTPEVEKRLLQALKVGTPFRYACTFAGISHTTAYRWQKQGREDRENHKRSKRRSFMEKVERAEAEAVTRGLGEIALQGKSDWRAWAWWLEHRHPEEFGDRSRLDVGGVVEHRHLHHSSLVAQGILEEDQNPVELDAGKRRRIAAIMLEETPHPADEEQEEEVLTGEVVKELPVRVQPRDPPPIRIPQDGNGDL